MAASDKPYGARGQVGWIIYEKPAEDALMQLDGQGCSSVVQAADRFFVQCDPARDRIVCYVVMSIDGEPTSHVWKVQRVRRFETTIVAEGQR